MFGDGNYLILSSSQVGLLDISESIISSKIPGYCLQFTFSNNYMQ